MKHRVCVVMAVYEPHLDWLREQLQSIEAQDFEGIFVLAADDASPNVAHKDIRAAFSNCLKKTPYHLFRNNHNLGSNQCFAVLTEMADSEYISYCDQDDIWLPDKTSMLIDALTSQGATLAYGDLSVIDKDGAVKANSLRDMRKRLVYYSGDNLGNILLFRNFTNGMNTVIKTKIAQSALPFAQDMVHDHWLTLWCAVSGKIAYLPRVTALYRLHDNNQSAVLTGVHSKDSYVQRRINVGLSRFDQYSQRLSQYTYLENAIQDGMQWFAARKRWFSLGRGAADIWRFRHLGLPVSMFELVTARLPEPLFMAAVRLVQRGIL